LSAHMTFLENCAQTGNPPRSLQWFITPQWDEICQYNNVTMLITRRIDPHQFDRFMWNSCGSDTACSGWYYCHIMRHHFRSHNFSMNFQCTPQSLEDCQVIYIKFLL
jgi:hypothetical protein